MTPDRALAVLGLDHAADWAEVRARHRHLIRTVHPDVGGDGRRAAELNEALEVLARATDHGAAPLPGPPRPSPLAPTTARTVPTDADRLLHIDVRPAELLLRLADAGHRVGEVVHVDPEDGVRQIVVGEGAASSQLVVSVGQPGEAGVPVAFTLEPLGPGADPPPIGRVVDALVAAVRAQR